MTNKESVFSVFAEVKKYSLLGWYRYLRLKIQGKTVVVEGQCQMCGKCCRRISLEAGGRWLRKKADFDRVVKRYPEYERFELVELDPQGFLLFTCSWYKLPEGICRDHENRLPICRDFPSISLYFTGGDMPAGCGYRFREVVPFASILQKELEAENEKKQSTDSHC